MNSNMQDNGASEWFEGISFLITSQMVVSSLISLALYVFWGSSQGISVLLGSLLVALNAWLMQRVFRREDVNQRDIYLSAALRYILFIGALLSFVWLGLNLLAVLGGMVLAYVVSYFFSAYTLLSIGRR
ncbi:MAG: ATP synthase subunit I [Mariprofundaceae bacterium]|nr:ATP synthase subunit I [Mariprofundaceae bacterium]